jgi:hypothetical protein
MKKIFLILSILVFANCKAQYTSTEPLENCFECDQTGVYYKDINNYLNTYEGTYVYNSGGIYFKMILQKKVVSNINNIFYEDILVGAYQYSDGTKLANCLSELNINYSNGWKYPINGNSIRTGKIMCEECGDSEKWLFMSIFDQSTNSISNFNLRKTVVNGQEAIKVFIRFPYRNNVITEDDLNSSQLEIAEPANYPTNQEITLIKQ